MEGQHCRGSVLGIVAGELHLFRDSSHLFCVELMLYLSVLNPQRVEEWPAFYVCMPDWSALIAVSQTHSFPSREVQWVTKPSPRLV